MLIGIIKTSDSEITIKFFLHYMQLPVMFWVYGGAFYSGSNNIYGMERIGDVADVIMVSVNYRVGTLGVYSNNKYIQMNI